MGSDQDDFIDQAKYVCPQHNNKSHSTRHKCLTFLWTRIVCFLACFFNNLQSLKQLRDKERLRWPGSMSYTEYSHLGPVRCFTVFSTFVRIHIWILPNIKGINNINSTQTLSRESKRKAHFLPHSMRPALLCDQNQTKILQNKSYQRYSSWT